MTVKCSNWKSPVPPGVGRSVKVIRPGHSDKFIADHILERAKVGFGVRVYRWACGTFAIAPRDGDADAKLEAKCPGELFGTYANGVTYWDVQRDLKFIQEAA